MAGGEMTVESASPRSPEAEIGIKVEDLWEVLEPQLTPTEKLNSCFQDLPVSSFPTPPSQVIEIPSDASLAETVEILSKHKILSAPVRDVDAPDDASWMDRYIGIVEFAGVSMWLLNQLHISANGNAGSTLARMNSFTYKKQASGVAENGHTSVNSQNNDDGSTSVTGSFFENLTSSEFYKNTKVKDISGSFRWAPFLALQTSDSFLTMLLLLSKYRVKSLPVVDFGDGKLVNIITQSSVVHMLAECAGLDWFENWGIKTLDELGLPNTKPFYLLKVKEDEPVLKAFLLMRQKGIGGLPVVDASGNYAVGNISIRDIQYLLTAPEIYKDYRTITVSDFLTAVRTYLTKQEADSPLLHGVVTCKRGDTMKEVIQKLDSKKIHRIYIIDENGLLKGVITLRDIISKLVHEPSNYFGDFFDGVLPLPEDSRV
ncbi:SNF1-related protein kinase regulatory subunit gamma-1 [Carex littledalei]|uniref:SNF1-related protein kinase regulatory subunit gamma-1 n=1 Tax=Carex littledalei TaxID=544730 RepID=A0A833QR71_9POAL|nr:SNF1-related protein kinase regulatory subunit gamma-1 [Carex littledalei]